MANSILITDAGLAEVINAEQSGTAPVVLTEVGLGTGKYTPTTDITELQAEFKRLNTIAGGAVGDNVIHMSVRDDGEDAYTVYEVGIYTASGTLFAVFSQTVPLLTKAAKSQALLAIDIVVSNFSADSVVLGDTAFFNPPATTTTLGVVELATNDEVGIGADSTRVVTPAGLSARTATENRSGLIKLANAQEVLSGRDDTKAVTPFTLIAAFLKDHGETGFQKLPSGLIMQWGKATVAPDGSTVIAMPSAFPTACIFANAVGLGALPIVFSAHTMSAGNIALKHNGDGGVISLWFAIGY